MIDIESLINKLLPFPWLDQRAFSDNTGPWKSYLKYFILIFLFYLTSPRLTNVGKGGHNSITNYCGPKNKG